MGNTTGFPPDVLFFRGGGGHYSRRGIQLDSPFVLCVHGKMRGDPVGFPLPEYPFFFSVRHGKEPDSPVSPTGSPPSRIVFPLFLVRGQRKMGGNSNQIPAPVFPPTFFFLSPLCFFPLSCGTSQRWILEGHPKLPSGLFLPCPGVQGNFSKIKSRRCCSQAVTKMSPVEAHWAQGTLKSWS